MNNFYLYGRRYDTLEYEFLGEFTKESVEEFMDLNMYSEHNQNGKYLNFKLKIFKNYTVGEY